MLTLERDELVFRFPEVHPDAVCRIEFQRTLRIPDDNRQYPLPPGLGTFPLSHVDDYAARVPAQWLERGGVLFPMAQAEAMWVKFNSSYPCAVKIAAGKINAVSGAAWKPELERAGHWDDEFVAHDLLARSPEDQAEYEKSLARSSRRTWVAGQQDYVVGTMVNQRWLDGFNVGNGQVRQFVAMPLGSEYTVEEQLTGKAVFGGLQIIVYPLKREHYNPRPQELRQEMAKGMVYAASASMSPLRSARSIDMGLAAGGLMRQKIYTDDFGFDKWDQSVSARCYVHLLNSQEYHQVTGKKPPVKAPTAAEYTKHGLPWFDVYDEHKSAVPGSSRLAGVDSVAALGVRKGETPLPDNAPLPVEPNVIKPAPNAVRQGDF
jgi:hypothetical protein